MKTCPNCGKLAVNLGRHFKPPRRSDRAGWDKAELLVRAGFLFQHIYKPGTNSEPIPYPKTLSEVRAFIEEYRDQAWSAALPEVLAAMPAT